MTFLIVCVVASIIWGAILICKIVDVIHISTRGGRNGKCRNLHHLRHNRIDSGQIPASAA